MVSALPFLGSALADVNTTRPEVMEIAIICAVVLIVAALANGLAARLLVPDRTLGQVATVTVFHATITAIAVFADFTPDRSRFGVQIAIFFVFAALMMGIYGINLGRAVGYTMLASLVFNLTVVLLDRIVVYEGGRMERNAETKETPPTQFPPRFATLQEAQAAAVRRYPELGKAGSEFNRRFLAKHAALKAKNASALTSPDWPMQIATEVAGELGAR